MMEDIALMLRSALPLNDVDRVMFGPSDGLTIVWVNISERPDLQVLSDWHFDGDGYAICSWFYAHPGKRNMVVGLRIEMRQPTRTVFHLAFNVERFMNPLSLISQTGKIWIILEPPPIHLAETMTMAAQDFTRKAAAHSGRGVMITLESRLVAELREQLTEWKQVTEQK